jgi:trigger factor
LRLRWARTLRYRAVFEVLPEVELRQVEGPPLTRSAAEVTDADVDTMVENLRAQRPKFVTVDRESHDGDRITS